MSIVSDENELLSEVEPARRPWSVPGPALALSETMCACGQDLRHGPLLGVEGGRSKDHSGLGHPK